MSRSMTLQQRDNKYHQSHLSEQWWHKAKKYSVRNMDILVLAEVVDTILLRLETLPAAQADTHPMASALRAH